MESYLAPTFHLAMAILWPYLAGGVVNEKILINYVPQNWKDQLTIRSPFKISIPPANFVAIDIESYANCYIS